MAGIHFTDLPNCICPPPMSNDVQTVNHDLSSFDNYSPTTLPPSNPSYLSPTVNDQFNSTHPSAPIRRTASSHFPSFPTLNMRTHRVPPNITAYPAGNKTTLSVNHNWSPRRVGGDVENESESKSDATVRRAHISNGYVGTHYTETIANKDHLLPYDPIHSRIMDDDSFIQSNPIDCDVNTNESNVNDPVLQKDLRLESYAYSVVVGSSVDNVYSGYPSFLDSDSTYHTKSLSKYLIHPACSNVKIVEGMSCQGVVDKLIENMRTCDAVVKTMKCAYLFIQIYSHGNSDSILVPRTTRHGVWPHKRLSGLDPIIPSASSFNVGSLREYEELNRHELFNLMIKAMSALGWFKVIILDNSCLTGPSVNYESVVCKFSSELASLIKNPGPVIKSFITSAVVNGSLDFSRCDHSWLQHGAVVTNFIDSCALGTTVGIFGKQEWTLSPPTVLMMSYEFIKHRRMSKSPMKSFFFDPTIKHLCDCVGPTCLLCILNAIQPLMSLMQVFPVWRYVPVDHNSPFSFTKTTFPAFPDSSLILEKPRWKSTLEAKYKRPTFKCVCPTRCHCVHLYN